MSTGYKGKFHRQNTLSRLAKDLVRRSRSHCELCEKNGVRLEGYELDPLPEEPSLENTLFICDGCHKQIAAPAKIIPNQWRFLSTAMWSEVPAVQVMSIRMLRRIAKTEHWAKELLEHAYLDPGLQEWADAAE